MSRKKKPIEELEFCVEGMRDSANRWNEIREKGCSDPFWPDGVNLNLVRNHIIYYQKKIQDLCADHGMIVPDEAYWELPPKVSERLFIGDKGSVRFKSIYQFYGKEIDFEVPGEYKPDGRSSLPDV